MFPAILGGVGPGQFIHKCILPTPHPSTPSTVSCAQQGLNILVVNKFTEQTLWREKPRGCENTAGAREWGQGDREVFQAEGPAESRAGWQEKPWALGISSAAVA